MIQVLLFLPFLFVVILSSGTGFSETPVEFEGETEVERELPSQLEIENAVLRQQVIDLKDQVADLKAIVLEQLNVIYQWVISR